MRLLNRTAGRISRHRRGRLAGVVMLMVGLVLTGGLYTVFAPAQADSSESDAALVAEGRELFLVSCSFCHGKNGEGVLTEGGTQYGPSLAGVGAASADFQLGTGRMPLTRPGQQVAVKPVVFDDDEIEALSAYVASLGPGPAVPDEKDYSLEGLSAAEREEAVTRGSQIFLTNCTACHNFSGNGGAMPRGGAAPNILGTTPEHIYEAMLTGPGNMDTFSNGNLSPEEKRDVIAYVSQLREQPEYGGFGLGGLGPVSEGMFAWLVGIGGLVGFAVWIAAHTTRSTKQPSKGADA
ncbi:c-type cytochrome [Nocardioides sp. 503]|uniref:cytochrome bc1 complex diheme cytochrome c subunit n=1 Tax=Nocardioides sp. 503 TaxID=2508326 RepID=UPI001FD673BB|nr:c-type cytochrome [Nocardioides sp. 503]